MAKKYKKSSQAEQTQVLDPVAPAVAAPETPDKGFFSKLAGFKIQAIIVSLLALIIYFNTFQNEFAHDDGIVIVKNEYVLEGFTGIKGIMTKDAYDSYYRQLNTTNQLKGGRFRPLSILTFAIEQEFFGAVPVEKIDSTLKQTLAYGVAGPGQEKLVSNMHIRHVFNVLWYMLSVVVLLYFLRYIIFPTNPIMALVAAIIFTAHPIHTEVVANVKSRDEIMSLLFMCLTFIYAFKYEDNKKKVWYLFAGLGSFLLAFLSKEYAITIIGLLPLALYIYRKYSIPKSITAVLPYLVVVAIYLGLRLNVLAPSLGEDETDPILTVFPKLGLIIAAVSLYLFTREPKKQLADQKVLTNRILLFLPFFLLSAIYLYTRLQAVPEVTESAAKEVLNNPYLFANPTEKIATEIATSLNYLKLLVFPHPLSADYSFATIPYKDFSHPMVILSLLIHIGMIVGLIVFFPKRQSVPAIPSAPSRPSMAVGWKGIMCFALAFYVSHLLLVNNIIFDIGATMGERLIYHSSVGFAIVVAYLLCKGAEKIKPAAQGQMALAAVLLIITGLYGFKTIDRNKAWKSDYTLFSTDIKTVPNSVLVNANVAASYITLADFEKTESGRRKYLQDAVTILDHTLTIHPTFVAAYLNRGIAWYKLGNVDKAKENVDHVKRLYPTYPTLPGMYKLISDFYLRNGWDTYGKNGRYAEAVVEYKKGLAIDPTNFDLWYNMGGALYTNRQFPEALEAFQKALQLAPGNQQAQQGYSATMLAINQMQGKPAK
jgi:tetratricopeptide (TPR) repeat protein